MSFTLPTCQVMTSWEALAEALQLRPLERHRVAKAVVVKPFHLEEKLLESLQPLNLDT